MLYNMVNYGDIFVWMVVIYFFVGFENWFLDIGELVKEEFIFINVED